MSFAFRRSHRRVAHPLRELSVGGGGNRQGYRSEQSEEKEETRTLEPGPGEFLHYVPPMLLVIFRRP
jgi:hypothetical protein